MKAYHFLMGNMRAGAGTEGPWIIGEEREIGEKLELCSRGYHSSKSWLDALNYAPGAMACIVDIPDSRHGTIVGDNKQVSPRRKLLAARDATQVLQLFACDCAERALRVTGVANEELWAIMRVARLYVNGEVGEEELKAARTTAATARAAYAAAYTAANVVANAIADATARVANAANVVANAIYAADTAYTADAAYAVAVARATRVEERAWQRRRLDWYMKKLFEEV